MAAAPVTPRKDLDMEEFRRRLQAEHDRLTADLKRLDEQDETGGVSGELGELANYDQHQADQGTELFFREQDEAIESSMNGELDQVESALRKIDNGSYGYCERCGTEIKTERLEVLPSAIYCIQCASDVAF